MSVSGGSTGEQFEKWLQDRNGKLSGSRIYDAVARTKKGDWTAGRRKIMVELLAETLTGQPTQSYLSQAMQWGIETEPQARAAYENRTGEQITLTGFVDHPKIPNAGCSPDGLVGYDGLVEIKCPETRTHIGYLLDRKIPDEYIAQINWQLACTQRKWCDFVSFDPRLPLGCNFIRIRINRDDKLIAGLEALAVGFLVEMTHALNAIENQHVLSEDVN